MADQRALRGLLEWSLAAFHAGFLFAGVVALLYAGGGLGELLGSLNTLLGLGLYALFWASTWWTTRQATRGIAWGALRDPWAPLDHFWRVVVWAGVNGLLLFGAVFVVIVTNALATALAGRALLGAMTSFVFAVGVLGTAVAFAIGAVAGIVFLLLDSALLALANRLVPTPEISA
jgi:hypothetical protein